MKNSFLLNQVHILKTRTFAFLKYVQESQSRTTECFAKWIAKEAEQGENQRLYFYGFS